MCSLWLVERNTGPSTQVNFAPIMQWQHLPMRAVHQALHRDVDVLLAQPLLEEPFRDDAHHDGRAAKHRDVSPSGSSVVRTEVADEALAGVEAVPFLEGVERDVEVLSLPPVVDESAEQHIVGVAIAKEDGDLVVLAPMLLNVVEDALHRRDTAAAADEDAGSCPSASFIGKPLP